MSASDDGSRNDKMCDNPPVTVANDVAEGIPVNECSGIGALCNESLVPLLIHISLITH